MVFSSENIDLFIYVFVTGVGCEIRYIGTTEMKNIPYIRAMALRSSSMSEKAGSFD